MLGRLFQRIKQRRAEKSITVNNYSKALRRYRKDHPESLEEENKQIQQWVNHIVARNYADQQRTKEIETSAKARELAEALYQMCEVARAAFMTHPAATESDFRRCWPSIREEMLKQHALEELAANPALSESFAKQASTASAETVQQSHGKNLQLLKTEWRD